MYFSDYIYLLCERAFIIYIHLINSQDRGILSVGVRLQLVRGSESSVKGSSQVIECVIVSLRVSQ